MILIVHNKNRVISVKTETGKLLEYNSQDSIALVLRKLSDNYINELILWCEEIAENDINFEIIPSIFHHKKILASFNPCPNNYINRLIGYVEHTPFININKKVSYPTWIMSSYVGGVNSDIIRAISKDFKFEYNFDYFLNSLAKLIMPIGVMCYSDPNLVKKTSKEIVKSCSLPQIFRFVKQHYKFRWTILLLIDLFLYEKRLALFSFLYGILFSKRKIKNTSFSSIEVDSIKDFKVSRKIDVIIPTLGRKKYLYDVLVDLKNQDLQPTSVIIIEQNPDKDSISELDYLTKELWPFKIEHVFIQEMGACNARNIALKKVTSDWVFFADDDIRIKKDFLSSCLFNIEKYKQKVITLACLRSNDIKTEHNPKQWGSFGSGCSLVDATIVKNINFNVQFEFGFGEDAEFGMQLRNNGYDVIYFPEPSLLHLKAPIGGFRKKPVLKWHNEPIQPKPSPTVLLMKLLHHTKEQIKGYKTIMIVNQYKYQETKNPIAYLIKIRKCWRVSLNWANKLKES